MVLSKENDLLTACLFYAQARAKTVFSHLKSENMVWSRQCCACCSLEQVKCTYLDQPIPLKLIGPRAEFLSSCYADHFILTERPSPLIYKWLPANVILRRKQRWRLVYLPIVLSARKP